MSEYPIRIELTKGIFPMPKFVFKVTSVICELVYETILEKFIMCNNFYIYTHMLICEEKCVDLRCEQTLQNVQEAVRL